MSDNNKQLTTKEAKLLEDAKLARVNRQRHTATSLSSADKFIRLKALDCFPEILSMCKNNYKPKEIAEFIQREAKFYSSISIDSLIKIVRDFIANEFHKYRTALDDDADLAPNNMEPELLPSGHPHQAMASQRIIKVNVLTELESLYSIQKSRIVDAHTAETGKGKNGNVNRAIGGEIKVAADLLHKIHNVREDLGLNKNHVKSAPEADEAVSPVFKSLIENPSRRGAVLEMAERLATADPSMVQGFVMAERKRAAIADAEIDEAEIEGGPLRDLADLEDDEE